MAESQTYPASVRAAEVARFDALAAQWWNPRGPMAPLHAMNPARIGWIAERMGPPPQRVLDIGCGAGLAAEALARRGHDVLGIDAAPEAVAVAVRHAAAEGLDVHYRVGAAETLVEEGVAVPVVTALEVIEHVADPVVFLGLMARLLEPGGRLFVSTINRTPRSLLVAKIGAEYVMRLLPRGTHDWRRFITPAELTAAARTAGLRMAASAGLTWSPLTGRWAPSRDLGINYIAMLTR